MNRLSMQQSWKGRRGSLHIQQGKWTMAAAPSLGGNSCVSDDPNCKIKLCVR